MVKKIKVKESKKQIELGLKYSEGYVDGFNDGFKEGKIDGIFRGIFLSLSIAFVIFLGYIVYDIMFDETTFVIYKDHKIQDNMSLDCEKSLYNRAEYPKACKKYNSCRFDCLYDNLIYIPVFKDDPETKDCSCENPVMKPKDLTLDFIKTHCTGYQCSSDDHTKCITYECFDTYVIRVQE